jgi:hypothetical protein
MLEGTQQSMRSAAAGLAEPGRGVARARSAGAGAGHATVRAIREDRDGEEPEVRRRVGDELEHLQAALCAVAEDGVRRGVAAA